jgi:plastocyanin
MIEKINIKSNKIRIKTLATIIVIILILLNFNNNRGNPYPPSRRPNQPKLSEGGIVEWERTYTEFPPVEERGYTVEPTFDGGYIIVGPRISPSTGDSDIFLLKTDGNGNEIWTKIYGDIDISDRGYCVKQTSDGGFVIVGHKFIGTSYEMILIKTDTNGNEIWTRVLDGTYGYWVEITSDGGFIVTGMVLNNNNWELILIKTDADGNKIWSKEFGTEFKSEVGYCVKQTSDEGYIITGMLESNQVWLIKTNANGDKVWERTYGGSLSECGYHVSLTSDGGYIIYGVTNSYGAGGNDVWLIKTDSNGIIVWDKTFGGLNHDGSILSTVHQTFDNGYIIATHTSSFGAGNYDGWLIKTDSNGNLLWDKTFGDSNYQSFYCGWQISDSGYIAVGSSRFFGESCVYLIKIYGVPVMDHPDDITYEEDTIGHNITWSPIEENPLNYLITKDGIEIASGSWDGTEILVSIDGLGRETYTYICTAYDQYGNNGSDTVIVNVVDTAPPTIDHPDDITYEGGSTGHAISWNPNDNNPNSYIITKNGSLVESGTWSGGPITFSVDGLNRGSYAYVCTIFDLDAQSASDTVIVNVIDTTPPSIDSPFDITYEEGTIDNFITWNPSDYNPDSYTITKDGVLVEDGTWGGGSITFNVDGLDLGIYTYVCTVYDLDAQSAIDTVIVNVVDTTPPIINHPDDIIYEQDSLGNNITWIPFDYNPNFYTITRNGVTVASGLWNGNQITLNVDGLNLGIYTCICTVYDINTYSVSDTVIVTVVDTTSPTIDHPDDITYEEGNTEISIIWNPNDNNPNFYTITKDGVIIESGLWNGESIGINVGGLSRGNYIYVCTVYDIDSLNVSDTVIVSVVDTVAPIIDHPGDITYEEGSTDHLIIWNPNDNNPDLYTITKDGVLVEDGTWGGGSITFNVDGLNRGSYAYVCTVYDLDAQSAIDTVIVNVVDTTPPTIDHPEDITYEEGDIDYLITWNPSDNNPYSYTITKDDVIIESGLWNGESIVINVSGLSIGNYTYICIVYDLDAQSTNDIVIVIVVDTNPPIIDPPDDIPDRGISGYDFVVLNIVICVISIIIIRSRKKNKFKWNINKNSN